MRRRTRQQKTTLVVAAAAVALGATVAGCLWKSGDESLGSFCAAPDTGFDEYCVAVSLGPDSAWSKAEANGALPIQMWAQWPSSVQHDEFLASETDLTAWFDNLDEVVSYVRDEEKNAESLRATLAGKLRGLLWRARHRQAEILEEEPVRAADNFKQAMTDKASDGKEPLVAALAADKQAMTAVQVIFDRARDDVAPLRSRYAGAAARFSAYRATEAAETAAYAALSAQASRAGLDGLDRVEQEVLGAAREASRAPDELAAEAMTLSAELQAFAASFEEEMAPHEEFLATHGAVLPDMTSGALRSLGAMLGYVQRRVSRSDAIATALLGGIATRRQALVVLQADEGSREAIARSRIRRASDVFSEGARAGRGAVGGVARERGARVAAPRRAVRGADGACADAAALRGGVVLLARGRVRAASRAVRCRGGGAQDGPAA
ncbi:hypothetical protein WME91_40535 [Sorangium sp. So ce269]